MDTQTLAALLQAGFAGVLLAYVIVVNRQFTALLAALDKHLQALTGIIEKCVDGDN